MFYSAPKSLKSCQSWKISEQSITGVQMEKSWRPLEQVQLANQIIGPLRSWLKKVKYLLPVCQILWCEESHSDFLLSLFILMSQNIEKRNPESGGLFWACADYLISLHPQCASNCKTLGRHLNWTILTNERIIVVLTMERCRLWSVGQCFNGEGHFKKLTLFATSSKKVNIQLFHSLKFQPLKCLLFKKKIIKKRLGGLTILKLSKQPGYVYLMSACLTQNRQEEKNL